MTTITGTFRATSSLFDHSRFAETFINTRCANLAIIITLLYISIRLSSSFSPRFAGNGRKYAKRSERLRFNIRINRLQHGFEEWNAGNFAA